MVEYLAYMVKGVTVLHLSCTSPCVGLHWYFTGGERGEGMKKG